MCLLHAVSAQMPLLAYELYMRGFKVSEAVTAAGSLRDMLACVDCNRV